MAFWPDLPKMLALPTTVNLATFMVDVMMEMIESDAESPNEKTLTVMQKQRPVWLLGGQYTWIRAKIMRIIIRTNILDQVNNLAWTPRPSLMRLTVAMRSSVVARLHHVKNCRRRRLANALFSSNPIHNPEARRSSRTENLKRLSGEKYDLVVVGGGATGCGVALDAATRGLKVALVERDDFGAGTSAR